MILMEADDDGKRIAELVEKGGSKGSPTKISGKSRESNCPKLDSACGAIEQDISEVRQLSRQLDRLGELDLDQFREYLNQTLEQARHDDFIMRTRSKLLEVDSTPRVVTMVRFERVKNVKVMHKMIKIRRSVSRSVTIERGQVTSEETGRSQPQWSCSATYEKEDASELAGDQTLVKVELLGLKRRALLDSGSRISILSLEVLLTAQSAGVDLDGDVEEIPQLQRPSIYDASGKRMNFKGAVRLSMRMKNGPNKGVAFFMMEGSAGRFVLGTNILKTRGYSLSIVGNDQKPVNVKQSSEKGEKDGREKRARILMNATEPTV
ncbi:hypothetical protein Y032_0012g1898 [Ancylostoma ceylanicum]|nr:hypothetical protein Y032_0012g1898 [Ancylostoma ceylanicum]